MPYPSSSEAIENRIRALDPPTGKKYAGYCTRFDLNHRTHEGPGGSSPGRLVSCLRLGTGTGEGRPRILILGGIHAREWVPPDAITTFVEKLLEAYRTSSAMTYPRWVDKRRSPSVPYAEIRIPFSPDVKLMIEGTELYVVPLVNPDGRAFSMSGFERHGWRKNRRPAPSGVTCPPLSGANTFDSNDPAGVDLNRNFDIAWDFNRYYSAKAVSDMTARGELGISESPCSPRQNFHGPKPEPASAPREIEPETRNVEELIDSKKINFFMDVHSAAGKILFPWGIEQNQEEKGENPEQSFQNPAFDRGSPSSPGRDGPGTAYKEWMPPGSLAAHEKLATHIAARIADSTGFTAKQVAEKDKTAEAAREDSKYDAAPAIGLFGKKPEFTTGASEEFAFSRSIGKDPGPPVKAKALGPVLAFTFECGRTADGAFQPKAEYPKVEREVAAGLAAFIAYPAKWRSPAKPAPSAPPATPAKSPSCCFIATAAYGSPFHPKVRYLCDIRDDELKTTEFGRRFMYGVERVYYSFSPQTADWLHRHERARRAVRHGIVEPWIAIVWSVEALTGWVRPAELRAGAFLSLVSVATLAAIAAIALLLFTLAHSLAGLA
jgi:hypothetical protein